MTLAMRTYACWGCGLAIDRDLNAARNILRRDIASAGWDTGPSGLRAGRASGASGDVPTTHAAGVPGQDAERYTAAHAQSGI